MAVQQFCLRWNNHQPNFISVFTDLLNNETLVDVTLAAEGKQLQAHKVVLSACSTYFQSLFTSTPCQHPIVILKDIKYNDLKTMVDFMYYGEVNVSQDQLPAILKTAETLKVKGLAEMPEGVSLSKSDSQGSESPWSLRRKRLRKSSTGSSEQTSTEDGAAGSIGSGGTLAAPSPLIKQETESEHHPPPPTRDPSTESDTARSHSFDTDEQPPNTPSRNLSEEQSETSNIKWSSSEEQKTNLIQQLPVIEGGGGGTMGSKRGRLLTRQHRIKKETDSNSTTEEDGGSERISVESIVERSSGIPRIERHCSEPSPQQHHLTVPHYLPKQNSSPHLSVIPQSHLSQNVPLGGFSDQQHSSQQHLPAPPPQVHVTPPTPTSPPPPSEPVRSRSFHEERRHSSSSSPQVCTVIESCEGSRACHCPALRPGPALGCNFCWNTIDTHGRILRRKTKYHCPDCQTNLCIVPCFQEYHERQNNLGIGSGGSNSGGGPPGSSQVGHTSHIGSTNIHGSTSSYGQSSVHGASSVSHSSSSGSHTSTGSHGTCSTIHCSSVSQCLSCSSSHTTPSGGNTGSSITHGHSVPTSSSSSSKDSVIADKISFKDHR